MCAVDGISDDLFALAGDHVGESARLRIYSVATLRVRRTPEFVLRGPDLGDLRALVHLPAERLASVDDAGRAHVWEVVH